MTLWKRDAWLHKRTHACGLCLLPLPAPPQAPPARPRPPTPATQPSDTSELMERLEDSLMTLGSMATNRYAAPFRAEVQAWIGCARGGLGAVAL